MSTQSNWPNPEQRELERQPLQAEILRFNEVSEGVIAIEGAWRSQYGSLDAQAPVVEERDMAAYTGITPEQNPIYNDAPASIVKLSEYAQSLAKPATEQDYDTKQAA